MLDYKGLGILMAETVKKAYCGPVLCAVSLFIAFERNVYQPWPCYWFLFHPQEVGLVLSHDSILAVGSDVQICSWILLAQ